MKICSPQLGLSPNSHLGGEVYDFNIIENLSKLGHTNYVLLPKDRDFKKNKNLKVSFLPIKHIFPPHIFNALALPYIFTTYKKERFQVLRIHSPFYLGFAAQIFKIFHPEVKIITDILLAEERKDFNFILKNTIHVYNHIFVLSDYLKKWIVMKYQVEESRITIIHGGVEKYLKPTKKDPKLVKKYGLKEKIVLLNIGLLIERKNPLFLLKIFKNLTFKFSNLVLIFCGTGELKTEMLAKVDECGLKGKVFILDPVYGDKKNKIFNLADIFMFPTQSEGFGLVAAEAMACGKPVIASNNSSLPEVIDDGINGFLAQTNNLDDWQSKTEKLINSKELREKFGHNALQKAKNVFNWRKVALRVVEGLEQIR